MKNSHCRAYVEAIIPVIAYRCRGKTFPVCVDAIHLLQEACKREGLLHSYGGNESHKVAKDLFEELDRQCKAQEEDDVFPLAIIKCTSRIIKTIGHGRELVINDKTTSAFYEQNAYASRSDKFSGFVLFSRQVKTAHPILRTAFTPRYKANRTEKTRLDRKITSMETSGLISSMDANSLRIQEDHRNVPLIAN